MRVERYTAPSINEALSQVKARLGSDAIILKTRKIPRRGMMGVFGREEIEVTAATPDNETIFRPLASGRLQSEPARSRQSIRDPKKNGGERDRAPQEDRMDLEALRGEIRELKTAVEGIRGTVEIIGDRVQYGDISAFPETLREFLRGLVENGVEKNLAMQLLEEVRAQGNEEGPADRTSVRESLVRRIANRFQPERQIPSAVLDPPSPSAPEEDSHIPLPAPQSEAARQAGSRPFVIAFLGPTGVGKTTALEKLAMKMKAREHREVAILCCDTCRIAAAKELEIFGGLMDIPVEAVYASEEMPNVLEQYEGKDVVLIDTAGRGATALDVLQEIEEFIRQARPDEVHLVLSATTKSEDLLNVLRQFETVPLNYLLFTKLDETASCGTLLTIAAETEKPISYVTWAPGIAEAIEPLDPFKMAEQIVGDNGFKEREAS